MRKYVVEYIENTPREWIVYDLIRGGTKTRPMTEKQFLAMDRQRESGEYIFLSIEVLDSKGKFE